MSLCPPFFPERTARGKAEDHIQIVSIVPIIPIIAIIAIIAKAEGVPRLDGGGTAGASTPGA